ncbi:hypothetical protein J5N97_000239 [Dioscorea zingiberensis]|uniref:SHSP domain-containing protein n=1 Tax=Dioscorea zingiberensis TaxID=325984 RepID=A0A9D5BSI3_9LILI|nr:hypothetical protein J5N97_000239 [Dioscorea zingiberensis]
MHMGERLSTLTPTRVKIVPGSGWTDDSNGHYLLVDLEGFNKEKVKLEVNTTAGHLTVTGERQVNEREHVYIEENFPIPANSGVDKITGKFDGLDSSSNQFQKVAADHFSMMRERSMEKLL